VKLKSIEITGFKSFPEKTEIQLSSGITVIVGPNGCGKSNLVDSIRWVLGEQSVKLMRGNRMEELIFSGTARRKPLNFADVTVLFDEAHHYLPLEYQTVSVSRRIYRSGEGEYFLNKKPCRLKDITELFIDTGIGVETYSLIGQGRVEQMITARPEEHRALFEEAAEIHRYKQRKKEARARLEEMHRNLLRVDDLLAEYEGQQEHLAERAARARQVKTLLAELKSVEKRLLVRQWAQHQEAYEKINKDVLRMNHTALEKDRLMQQLTAKLEIFQGERHTAVKDLEKAREHFQKHKEEIDTLQNQVFLLREKIKHAGELRAYKEESLEEVQGRMAGLGDTLRENEGQLLAVQEEQEALSKRVDFLTARLEKAREAEHLELLEAARTSLSEHNQEIALCKQRIEDDRQRARENRQKRTAVAHGIEEKEQRLRSLQGQKTAGLAARKRLQEERATLEQHGQHLDSSVEKVQATVGKKRQLVHDLHREMENKKARYKYLKESDEDFSYFQHGVKAVMQWAQGATTVEGIYGPFIQLIQVLPQYDKAIETALGTSGQFIVVADENRARQAIEYLKSKQAGRATFLPLSRLRPAKKELPSRPLEGVIERASQLVDAPAPYQKAVDYLLGGTLVARDLELAVKAARQAAAGWKIVTLEGEMITPGGAISGGSSSRQAGSFLARKRERETLAREIKRLEEREAAEMEQLRQHEERMQDLEEKRNAARQQQAALDSARAQQDHELARLADDLQKVQEELAVLQEERQELDRAWETLERARNTREEALQSAEEAVRELQDRLQELGRQAQREESQHKKIQEERIELRVRFSACQEKESALQHNLLKQREEQEHLQELANSLQQESERLQTELNQSQEKERTLLQQIAVEKEQGALLDQEVDRLETARRTMELEAADTEARLEKEKRSLERLQKRTQQGELEGVRYREASRYLGEQLLEKYQLDTRALSWEEDKDEGSEEALIQEKQRLEEELAAKGEVDLRVIDEFERLQQRTRFLQEQRKDLVEGEKGVRSVLSELDRHMEKRFLEALRAIEMHFQDSFQHLFGGGQALLRLTDPDHVLESGIEIVAQPPGKKLQTLSLLSGGEKALTAIALLFALLKYKPVPFCVLDEIDSSLDENNLARFLDFLRAHTEKTQFVVITHKRRTMEEANVLYGVTMEEQGVSKVISLHVSQKAG